MKRVMGIDLGERRVGLALADLDPPGRAYPLDTLRRTATPAEDAAALLPLIVRHAVAELVVGLPLEASGIMGFQARTTQTWVDSIGPLLGLPIALRDERLSSHLAEQRLGPMKRGRSGGAPTPAQRARHRARVDREAAAIILQDELDARASVGGPAAGAPESHNGPGAAG